MPCNKIDLFTYLVTLCNDSHNNLTYKKNLDLSLKTKKVIQSDEFLINSIIHEHSSTMILPLYIYNREQMTSYLYNFCWHNLKFIL